MNINSILTSFWSNVKTYLSNNYLGKDAQAKSAEKVNWDGVQGKPTYYTPATHSHTEYLGKTDKAESATTADKITLTDTNPTSASTYQITFASSTSNNTQRVNNGLKYYTLEGTASANGYGQIFLGNSTAEGTAGNKYGNLRIYSKSSNYAVISGNTTLTANRTLTVPDAGGTILTTNNLASIIAGGATDKKITHQVGTIVFAVTRKSFNLNISDMMGVTVSGAYLTVGSILVNGYGSTGTPSFPTFTVTGFASGGDPNNDSISGDMTITSRSEHCLQSGTWKLLGAISQNNTQQTRSWFGMWVRVA